MRKLIILGTIHGRISRKEIERILNNLNPDQILIEMINKDVKSKNFKEYPTEMKFAYGWAKDHNKKVYGFDDGTFPYKNKTMLTEKDHERIEKLNSYLKGKDWKELNKAKYFKEFWRVLGEDPIPKGQRPRQKNMLKNIKKFGVREGKIVIFTGVSHLDFFEKNLPGAKFPFK